MKNSTKRKLQAAIELLIGRIRESDYDTEKHQWKSEELIRFKNLDSSWRNICSNYRKHFDSKGDYALDLNLFAYELKVREIKYILRHLFGAETTYEHLMGLVVKEPENALDIAVKIINSLKYEII